MLKKILPNFLINLLKNILNIKKTIFLQKLYKDLNFINKKEIIYLGTEYGGWSFVDNENITNSYIISAGLGEDASFDTELIDRYKCKLIIVDPTPGAIKHFNEIISKAGNSKLKPYNDTGKQDIDSYNLKNINKQNFILIDSALYNEDNKQLKFFSPPNKNHISHSINNWQNDYKKDTDFISVNTISLIKIMKKFNIINLEMIKLDIEGAEIEVLEDMIRNKIYPNQILVEFHELNKISKRGVER